MITLKKYDVNEIVFENILSTFKEHIKVVPTIDPYRGGYRNSLDIYYDGKEYLVMRECELQYSIGDGFSSDCTYWKQVVVRKTRQNDKIQAGVDGLHAWNYVNRILDKYYTKSEIEECLNTHTAEYDYDKAQVHYNIEVKSMLMIFDDCYKYDINGAHNDALCEIFPKAREEFEWLFKHRKDNPHYKSYVNYYVGFLCKRNHRLTYNWIVQRTTKILNDAIEYTEGRLIYANTDGFIVHRPKHLIQHSDELGKFKEEYKGQVRFYKDKNWFAYEIDTDNEDKRVTGNIRLSARRCINLKDKIIVHYDLVGKMIDDEYSYFSVENLTEERVNEEIKY